MRGTYRLHNTELTNIEALHKKLTMTLLAVNIHAQQIHRSDDSGTDPHAGNTTSVERRSEHKPLQLRWCVPTFYSAFSRASLGENLHAHGDAKVCDR